jgi:chromosome segregation ATPase
VDEGFIDLRQGPAAGVGTDTFWPSFTDIMMVVVMIFMIASTVLMLRNWDLVRELRTTIEAERQAEALARSMTETSATLEEQLAQVQHANSVLRMKLMRQVEINRSTSEHLAKQEQQILALQGEKQQLTASLQQSTREIQLQADQLQQVRAEKTQLADTHATLQERLQQVLAELAQVETTSREKAAELAELRQYRSTTGQELLSLQGEYDELQVKYNKLIRPARSAVGRHVVSVRYWKEDDGYQIRIRDAGEDEYRTVTREELEQELSELKGAYPDNLYVKLIIPDDSGLSYSEAWGFTFNILQKYDYYHQD